MLAQEQGTISGSDLYLLTPSDVAQRSLYYLKACGYYYTDDSYCIRRDTYHSDLILFLCHGKMSIRNEDRRETVSAGQVCYICCDAPHEYRSIGHAEFVWAHLAGPNLHVFRDWLIQKNNGHVISVLQPELFRELLFSFVYEMRSHQLHNELACSAKLYQLLIMMIDETALDPPAELPAQSTAIADVMRFMEKECGRPLSLDLLSRKANMSKYHFSRRFKQECGFSPHVYLTMLRMNKAMYLLKTTDLPVREISLMVGYQNESTFSTAFHDRIGLSPLRFRLSPI